MMAQNIIPKGNNVLVELGIGSLIGVLFAPKSGQGTRKDLAKKPSEGNECARKEAQGVGIVLKTQSNAAKKRFRSRKNKLPRQSM
jgi:gas vesicle protein